MNAPSSNRKSAIANRKCSPLSPARRTEILSFFGGFAPADNPITFTPPPHILDALTATPPGRCALITGPSGSGKSTLLRAAANAFSKAITFRPLPNRPLIDLFGPNTSVREVLHTLAPFGLAEAGLLTRTPTQLSDGQRWRLCLAHSLHRARRTKAVLIIDEFASLLDPLHAQITSTVFAKALANTNQRALLATWRTDLTQSLNPHTQITCDYGHWETIPSRTKHSALTAHHAHRTARSPLPSASLS